MTASSRKHRKHQRDMARQAARERLGVKLAEATQVEAPAPVVEQPTKAPARKRVQKLLETAAHELDELETAILDQMLDAAREAIALHKSEAHARNEAHTRGEPVPKRWEVSPGVYDRICAKALRIIEIRLARRRGLKEAEARLAG
ncbi:MAG: hypothetical protein KDB90_08265 [Planctomycetes bacterium]|nr:hypothetical protein [Planctomycetota bacterium]